MPQDGTIERPHGVYLVAFYFVVTGFVESIKAFHESTVPLSLNPIAEDSIWQLVVQTLIYLALAYLIWNFAAFGRLAALVYGYVILAMYVAMVGVYLLYDGETPLTITPLDVSIAIFRVSGLIPVIAYLRPQRQKKLFNVHVIDLLLSSD